MAKPQKSKHTGKPGSRKRTGKLERIAFGVLVAAALVMIVFFLLMRTSNDISIAENTTDRCSRRANAVSSATK
jgi:cell division protein FtsL